MPITLESRVRRMQVVNLPHDVFCRNRCACADVTVVVSAENPRTGDRASKRVAKQLPSSMTWLALERKVALPSALLDVPDVKAAIARGHLRVVEHTPDPAPPPTTVGAEPVTPAPVPHGAAPVQKEA